MENNNKHTPEVPERAEQIYLKHYAENREQGKGLSESQVAVNAMMDFYEQMKNKDNGNQTSTIR